MELLPALAGLVVGLLGGLAVPRIVAWCPEPRHDPSENPDEFPDHVPFAELARRPRLALRSGTAGALVGGILGLAIGDGWALLWLLAVVGPCLALAVIDYVTWYLPKRLVWTSYGVVAVLEVVAAVALDEPLLLVLALGGMVALVLYYGLLWFISPRMMAFGDVRLAGLIGLALGPLGVMTLLVSVLAAAVLSVLAYVPMKLRGNAIRREGVRGPLKDNLPYGPFLLLGALVAVVVGRVLAVS
ncbi:leader peptidase (prepilin peptidase)/N-methyltransferase [Nocardioides sp. J9]|uniref:prepilin peptidase n=1 Tax=unclassified Nocardioides TaxID=2615069 RepID=UPI0004BA9956|nr:MULTISPECIES: A24 family peptidase [unclassified Nocardioides]TWG93533.1 leader peptidase (prepilin peptidase)/N-methyltransferase [Nocardioides sp. J9]